MADRATVYTPGAQNDPFGLKHTNPQSSNYAAESDTTYTESNLIAKAIKYAIFDSAPEQYNLLKLLYMKPSIPKPSDEFDYVETGFGRSVLTTNGTATAQAASANTVQTQTITFTAASITTMQPNLVLSYPDNSTATITGISTNDVTVKGVTGKGLPAVASGDKFSIKGTIRGDGMSAFENFERIRTITRTNYIQFFLRAERWDRVELQKHMNMGTTDYVQKQKEHKMKQLRVDMLAAFLNGERGEYTLKDGIIAKGMGGIFPTMVAAGSASANTSTSGFKSNFEMLAFRTNYKAEGGTRFLVGTDEMLYNFAKVYKHEGTRYSPSDQIANLNLTQVKLGSMNFVYLPCELMREQSVFPSSFSKRILCLDMNTISPCYMSGIPQMNAGSTLRKGNGGTREDFQDFFVEAQLSLEMNNPKSSFYIDFV